MNLSSKDFPLEWRTFVSSILKKNDLYYIRDRYTKYTQQIRDRILLKYQIVFYFFFNQMILTIEVKYKHK